MSLRVRLGGTFALVALLTGLAVALAAPTIVGRGFARLEGDSASPAAGGGMSQGSSLGGRSRAGPGPIAGAHAQQIQQETTQTIVLVALLAAAGASLVGFIIAGRIAGPLRRLEDAAGAVAGGDLSRRSGIADRRGEIGSLGRSFDAMAAQLESVDGSRRRFLQDAAHELKTPLAVIEATATAILDGVYEHDRTHLETIRGQSRILARIVDDLRTISLAESGSLPLRNEPVDVSEVVSGVVSSLRVRAELAGLTLSSDVPSHMMVLGDGDRIRQVLVAYLDNATRHSPAGGQVSVSATGPAVGAGPAGRFRLSVTDAGPGIQPDALGHVFDRFFQADQARSDLGDVRARPLDREGARRGNGRGCRGRIDAGRRQHVLDRAAGGRPPVPCASARVLTSDV